MIHCRCFLKIKGGECTVELHHHTIEKDENGEQDKSSINDIMFRVKLNSPSLRGSYGDLFHVINSCLS